MNGKEQFGIDADKQAWINDLFEVSDIEMLKNNVVKAFDEQSDNTALTWVDMLDDKTIDNIARENSFHRSAVLVFVNAITAYANSVISYELNHYQNYETGDSFFSGLNICLEPNVKRLERGAIQTKTLK